MGRCSKIELLIFFRWEPFGEKKTLTFCVLIIIFLGQFQKTAWNQG